MSTTDDVNAATTALNALADTEDGAVLAGQLSRLVLVIAGEAARTKRFRGDLLAALALEPEADPAAAGPLTRARLQRLTKPDLRKLIDRDRMDPNRTIKSRSTKGEMIDLIISFGASSTEPMAPQPEDRQPENRSQPAAAVDSLTASPTPEASPAAESEAGGTDAPSAISPANPPRRRRRPSPLDPYAVAASDGVEGLREHLQPFDIEELKDVIAEYGMNHDGRAMSWKDRHRLVERILEKADFGATQGNAFRSGR